MQYTGLLEQMLQDSISAKKDLLADGGQIQNFAQAAQLAVSAYRQGGRLYIAGNGGSAADAQHLAAELVSKFAMERNPLPAEALTVDSSILTAVANDYGYDNLFSRQLAAKATDRDVFLAITTSGNSSNIIHGLQEARKLKLPSILFTGGTGGKARKLADISVTAQSSITSVIQETHIVLLHALCACIEQSIFAE